MNVVAVTWEPEASVPCPCGPLLRMWTSNLFGSRGPHMQEIPSPLSPEFTLILVTFRQLYRKGLCGSNTLSPFLSESWPSFTRACLGLYSELFTGLFTISWTLASGLGLPLHGTPHVRQKCQVTNQARIDDQEICKRRYTNDEAAYCQMLPSLVVREIQRNSSEAPFPG